MPDGEIEPFEGDDRHALVVALIPKRLAGRLRAFCDEQGEQLHEVVADAIALHIDAMEPAEPDSTRIAQVVS